MTQIQSAQARAKILLEQHKINASAPMSPPTVEAFGNITIKLAIAMDDLLRSHRQAGHPFPPSDAVTMQILQAVTARLGSISWGAAMISLARTGEDRPNARLLTELGMDSLRAELAAARIGSQ